MVTVKLSGRPDGPYAPFLVGDTGMLLVEQCDYIEGVFGGLLAHPVLYPSPQNCEEIRYSFSGADGTSLLTEDSPVAANISEEDVARLERGLAALKAMEPGALTTQRAAIAAFRLPNFQRHSRFYRQCVDPTTGEKRLAIIWGVGVRDELGQVLDDGPILNVTRSALVALLPPVSATEIAPILDTDQEDVKGVSTMLMSAPPTETEGSSKCKCWTVATVFLLVLALLAGLFYWWAQRQYTTLAAGQRILGDSVTVLRDQMDVMGTKLDEMASTVTTRLAAVQRLLRWYLPLPKSRVIPLDRYHAGPWYPFQNPKRPGEIADPKSSVVVGSAIEYLCSMGHAPGDIRVDIRRSEALYHSFYWGVAREDDRYFRNDEAFFQPVEELPEDEANLATFTFVGIRAIIARRLSSNENAEVSPIYGIGVRSKKEHGPVTVTIERSRTASGEECLRLVKAEGEVDGVAAEAGKNIVMELRTLFEERYFLDTEAFYGIDYDAITED